MTVRLYRVGDHVLLLEPLPDGWIGTATITSNQTREDPTVDFEKDDPDAGESPTGFCHWSKLELITPVDDQALLTGRGHRKIRTFPYANPVAQNTIS